MKEKLIKMMIVLLLAGWVMPTLAQSAATEPRATKGGTVVLQFKNIPSEDVNNVNGVILLPDDWNASSP